MTIQTSTVYSHRDWVYFVLRHALQKRGAADLGPCRSIGFRKPGLVRPSMQTWKKPGELAGINAMRNNKAIIISI